MSYSDQHYGPGDPDCPICHGIGYIRYDVPENHPLFGKAIDCKCRRNDVENKRLSHMRRMGGLDNLADKTFESFNPDGIGLTEHRRNNLRLVYELVRNFAEDLGGWLVITGGYGCGKTHLAAAVANYQILQGNAVLFVTVPDLLDYLRSSFNPALSQEEQYQSRFDEIKTAPLLILDDLGIENATSWAVEKLYQILNYRYNAKIPTVITTNHKPDELEPRIRSRFFDPDLSQVLSITAPDYRQSGIASLQSDLNGLGLYAHMRFDTFELRRDLPRAEVDNLRRASEAARTYAKEPQGWLILMGSYGCGKTHLAAAIANQHAEDQGESVLFVTMPDLLDHLRSTFAPNSSTSYDKRFNQVKTAQLLILDDLGFESATPWAREKLNQLFNYRYNARLPTVITTAHTLEDLEKTMPRLAVRLRDKRISKMIVILAPAYLGRAQNS